MIIYSKSGGYWAGNSSNYLEFSAENAKSSSIFFVFRMFGNDELVQEKLRFDL